MAPSMFGALSWERDSRWERLPTPPEAMIWALVAGGDFVELIEGGALHGAVDLDCGAEESGYASLAERRDGLDHSLLACCSPTLQRDSAVTGVH